MSPGSLPGVQPVKASLVFAASYLVVLAVFMGFAIFGHGQFEPMWGPAISFQVALWLVGGLALLAFAAHWLGQALALGRRGFPAILHLTTGTLAAGFLAVCAWLELAPPPPVVWVFLALLPLAVGFVSRGFRRPSVLQTRRASLLLLLCLIAVGGCDQLRPPQDEEIRRSAKSPRASLEFRLVMEDSAPGGQEFPSKTELSGVDRPYRLEDEVILTEKDLVRVAVGRGVFNDPVVNLRFSEEAGSRLKEWTGANVGRLLAIIVDGEVVSAATIQDRVERDAVIHGNFKKDEARRLAQSLAP